MRTHRWTQAAGNARTCPKERTISVYLSEHFLFFIKKAIAESPCIPWTRTQKRAFRKIWRVQHFSFSSHLRRSSKHLIFRANLLTTGSAVCLKPKYRKCSSDLRLRRSSGDRPRNSNLEVQTNSQKLPFRISRVWAPISGRRWFDGKGIRGGLRNVFEFA